MLFGRSTLRNRQMLSENNNADINDDDTNKCYKQGQARCSDSLALTVGEGGRTFLERYFISFKIQT